jgi:hypothetical protein
MTHRKDRFFLLGSALTGTRSFWRMAIPLFLLMGSCKISPPPPPLSFGSFQAVLTSPDPHCVCGLDTFLPGCPIGISIEIEVVGGKPEEIQALSGLPVTVTLTIPRDPPVELTSFTSPLRFLSENTRAVIEGGFTSLSVTEASTLFFDRRNGINFSAEIPNRTRLEGILTFAIPPTDDTPAIACVYWTDSNRNPFRFGPFSPSPEPQGEACGFFEPITEGILAHRVKIGLTLRELDVFDPSDILAEDHPPSSFSEDRRIAYWDLPPRGGDDSRPGFPDDCRYAFTVAITGPGTDPFGRPIAMTFDALESASFPRGCRE